MGFRSLYFRIPPASPRNSQRRQAITGGMSRMVSRSLLIAAAVIAAAIALAAGSLALAWYTMPVSDLGFAYKLGARMALTSDDAHAIWEGRAPQHIVFRRRQHDSSNKYVWQEAILTRPGNCLDLIDDKGAPMKRSRLCDPRDKIEPQADRFYFKVEDDKSIGLGVRTTPPPPDDGRRIGHGGLFEVEGSIGFGTNFDRATSFKIEINAAGLNIADLSVPGNPNMQPDDDGDEASGCGKPRYVRAKEPFVLAALPPVAARLCRFRSQDNKKTMALVHFQRTPMQRWRWTDDLYCRALLNDLMGNKVDTDFAVCLGGPWGEIDATALTLALFEVKAGSLARLQ
jgi:hypothetical protein